jgi:hypothetical protein
VLGNAYTTRAAPATNAPDVCGFAGVNSRDIDRVLTSLNS